MAQYKVVRNGKTYVYTYDRSKYRNNTAEYNKAYWEEHKVELRKRAKLRRIEKKLEAIPNERDRLQRSENKGNKQK